MQVNRNFKTFWPCYILLHGHRCLQNELSIIYSTFNLPWRCWPVLSEDTPLIWLSPLYLAPTMPVWRDKWTSDLVYRREICYKYKYTPNILTVGKIIFGFRLSCGFHKQKNDKFYLSRSGDSIKILKMVCTIWHIWQYSDRPLCISFLVANSQ